MADDMSALEITEGLLHQAGRQPTGSGPLRIHPCRARLAATLSRY